MVLAPQTPRPERRQGQLSERDLTFVGIGGPLHAPGWHSVSEFGLFASVDEQDLDPDLGPAFAATLQALVSRDRLEFLA